jgi:hypothetical protein
VTSLTVYDDGTGPALLAGGVSWNFQGVPPQTHYGVVKWNGQAWSPTGFPASPGGDGVTDMVGYDDGQGPALYAAVPGMSQSTLRRWKNGVWSSVPSALMQVRTLAVFDDGAGGGPALYAGGSFMTAGGVPAKNIARLLNGEWSDVGGGVYFSSTASASVGCVRVLDLGQGRGCFVGGAFKPRRQPSRQTSWPRWDGSAWTGYRFLGYPMYQFVPPIVTSLAALRNTTPPLLLAGTDYFTTLPAGLSGLIAWDGERWFAAGGPATPQSTPSLPVKARRLEVLVGGWMPGPCVARRMDAAAAVLRQLRLEFLPRPSSMSTTTSASSRSSRQAMSGPTATPPAPPRPERQ